IYAGTPTALPPAAPCPGRPGCPRPACARTRRCAWAPCGSGRTQPPGRAPAGSGCPQTRCMSKEGPANHESKM
ncbi:hypothetical protein IscW_ISCW009119, partial [Ixodes scapularis]